MPYLAATTVLLATERGAQPSLWRCHWSLHRRNTSDLSSLPDKQSSHIFANFIRRFLRFASSALCFVCALLTLCFVWALLTARQWPDANNAAT